MADESVPGRIGAHPWEGGSSPASPAPSRRVARPPVAEGAPCRHEAGRRLRPRPRPCGPLPRPPRRPPCPLPSAPRPDADEDAGSRPKRKEELPGVAPGGPLPTLLTENYRTIAPLCLSPAGAEPCDTVWIESSIEVSGVSLGAVIVEGFMAFLVGRLEVHDDLAWRLRRQRRRRHQEVVSAHQLAQGSSRHRAGGGAQRPLRHR